MKQECKMCLAQSHGICLRGPMIEEPVEQPFPELGWTITGGHVAVSLKNAVNVLESNRGSLTPEEIELGGELGQLVRGAEKGLEKNEPMKASLGVDLLRRIFSATSPVMMEVKGGVAMAVNQELGNKMNWMAGSEFYLRPDITAEELLQRLTYFQEGTSLLRQSVKIVDYLRQVLSPENYRWLVDWLPHLTNVKTVGRLDRVEIVLRNRVSSGEGEASERERELGDRILEDLEIVRNELKNLGFTKVEE